jgi:hybrid cluster-associated redox disulfide protein
MTVIDRINQLFVSGGNGNKGDIIMSEIALFFAFLALVLTLRANSRQKRLAWDIERVQHRGTSNMTEIEEIRSLFTGELRKLKLELRKTKGGPLFTKETTFGEVLELHPRGREILARFHIGGCSSCAVSEFETIEQGASSHGVNMDQLLDQLNQPEEAEAGSPSSGTRVPAQFVQFPK